MVAISDNSAAFLKYVHELGLALDKQINVVSKLEFDESLEIEIAKKTIRVSQKFAQHIFVIPLKSREQNAPKK